MQKCSFCGGVLKPATGKMLVRTDGKIFYFCKSKCQKNFNLGRAGKEHKWTKLYNKVAKKEEGKS